MSTMTTGNPTRCRRATATGNRRSFAHDAAHARRERAQQRDGERAHILELLGRGAGISQILSEIGRREDPVNIQVARALHLRRVLDAVAQDAPSALGVRIAPPDMARTVAFLERRITFMQDAVAGQQRRRASRLRREPHTKRPATDRHDSSTH